MYRPCRLAQVAGGRPALRQPLRFYNFANGECRTSENWLGCRKRPAICWSQGALGEGHHPKVMTHDGNRLTNRVPYAQRRGDRDLRLAIAYELASGAAGHTRRSSAPRSPSLDGSPYFLSRGTPPSPRMAAMPPQPPFAQDEQRRPVWPAPNASAAKRARREDDREPKAGPGPPIRSRAQILSPWHKGTGQDDEPRRAALTRNHATTTTQGGHRCRRQHRGGNLRRDRPVNSTVGARHKKPAARTHLCPARRGGQRYKFQRAGRDSEVRPVVPRLSAARS